MTYFVSYMLTDMSDSTTESFTSKAKAEAFARLLRRQCAYSVRLWAE